jgi:hypothetical protein
MEIIYSEILYYIKKSITSNLFIIFLIILFSSHINAQSPSLMNYQAIVRNSSGSVIQAKLIKLRVSVLKGSTSGTSVYSEIHNPMTDSNGIINLIIGRGTQQSGSITSINWGSDSHFIKTEIDPNNGTNYSITGASQLLSVPYALYAENTPDKEKVLYYGNNATDTVELPSNVDIYSTYDGAWNRWVQLPVKSISNNNLKLRRNTTLLLTSYSSFDFRILPRETDLTSELLLNYGDYALFVFDHERWRLVSSSKTTIPHGAKEDQVLTMCGGYPNWGPCLPRLNTSLADVKTTSAKSGGNIYYTGGQNITARGVVWSTNPMPTIALPTKTSDGFGSGIFTSDISGLLPNTTYYIRAYATTVNGTGYGFQVNFKTPQ